MEYNTLYKNKTTKEERGSHIYEICDQPGIWRIRLHIYPDTKFWPCWYGGMILWGFDQKDKTEAERIANQWVKKGIFPVKKEWQELFGVR